MSDDKTSKKKGGRSKKWILLSALILVLGGMGAAGGFFAAGMLGGHATAATEDPNRPKLVLKGEGDRKSSRLNPDTTATLVCRLLLERQRLQLKERHTNIPRTILLAQVKSE